MNETDYAQLVRDAEDVAAQRTRMGVKPRGGPTRFPARGPYEESNITDLTNPFPTSLGQAGLMLALGPLAGRYLGKVGAEIGPGIIRKLLAPSAALPVGAAAGGAMLDPEEAQARFNAAMVARRFVPVPKGSTGYKPGLVVPRSRITVEDPLRAANPGIYTKDPRQIAAEAAALVQQEDPSLQQIFGVSRQDLYDIAQQRVRQYGGANMPSLVRLPPNPRGSAAAQRIMTPQNEQRILDIMMEGQKYPQLERPMRAWYVQDPIYDIYGNRVPNPEDRFNQFNVFHSMASPGSCCECGNPARDRRSLHASARTLAGFCCVWRRHARARHPTNTHVPARNAEHPWPYVSSDIARSPDGENDRGAASRQSQPAGLGANDATQGAGIHRRLGRAADRLQLE